MKKNNYLLIIELIVFISFTLSCNETPEIIQPTLKPDNYVFIINEGTYTWNNGSISAYSPEKKEVTQKVFENANGLKPGDVPQSIAFYNNQAYICVNNSKKIHAVTLPDFKLKNTFTECLSPRFMTISSTGIGYVSDLYDKKITIYDLNSGRYSGEITTNKTTESLLLKDNILIASNWSFGRTVQLFDTKTLSLIKEIEVGLEPNSMVLDKENKLWVLCAGGFTNSEFPKLYKINIESFTIEKTLTFANINSSPTRLCLNADSTELLYLNSGIYSYKINSENLSEIPLIESENRNLYGLAVCPMTGDIYISDAKDFVSKSTIYRYAKNGSLIDKFEAGIGAGGFGFYKPE